MSGDRIENLLEYCLDVARRANVAAAGLARVSPARKHAWLGHSANLLRQRSAALAEANDQD